MVKNKDLILYGAIAAGLYLLTKSKSLNGIGSHPEYYGRQMERLADPGGYIYAPKIRLTSDTGSTNVLNLNSDTMSVLNAWFKRNKKNIR